MQGATDMAHVVTLKLEGEHGCSIKASLKKYSDVRAHGFRARNVTVMHLLLVLGFIVWNI
jgi:hypothetical protein